MAVYRDGQKGEDITKRAANIMNFCNELESLSSRCVPALMHVNLMEAHALHAQAYCFCKQHDYCLNKHIGWEYGKLLWLSYFNTSCIQGATSYMQKQPGLRLTGMYQGSCQTSDCLLSLSSTGRALSQWHLGWSQRAAVQHTTTKSKMASLQRCNCSEV